MSSNRHARAQTLSSLGAHVMTPLSGCLRVAVGHAALSVQFDTCLRGAWAPTHAGPTDPTLALLSGDSWPPGPQASAPT